MTLTRRGFVAASALLAAPSIGLGQAALRPVRLSLNFVRDGSNANLFLAEQRGWFREAGLAVTLDASSGALDAVQRVATGVYDISIADVNVLFEFVARNPDTGPKAIAVLYDRSPLAIVSLKRHGIVRPADLHGKTLAAPQTDGAFRLFPAFARATGIDVSRITLSNVEIRLREALVLRGDAQGAFGFDSSVFFNLKNNGVALADTSFLYYADHGLDLYSNAILASRRVMAERPDVVRDTLRVMLRAWQAAIREPQACVEALARADQLIRADLELERLAWLIQNQIGTPAIKTGGIATVDQARLNRSFDQVAETLGLPRPATDAVYDPNFLPPAAERAWPT